MQTHINPLPCKLKSGLGDGTDHICVQSSVKSTQTVFCPDILAAVLFVWERGNMKYEIYSFFPPPFPPGTHTSPMFQYMSVACRWRH
jgi:hypothetical protein